MPIPVPVQGKGARTPLTGVGIKTLPDNMSCAALFLRRLKAEFG